MEGGQPCRGRSCRCLRRAGNHFRLRRNGGRSPGRIRCRSEGLDAGGTPGLRAPGPDFSGTWPRCQL